MSTNEPQLLTLTAAKVRQLTADDLGLDVPAATHTTVTASSPIELLPSDDVMLTKVKELLESFGGVIFVGPPGTSKSWYATHVAATLADGDPKRFRPIQFHPSYQYEDFVEGYVPTTEGFALHDKHFLQMCERASRLPEDEYCVLVIDELSRGDPGRVFGEALTYVEKTKRGLPFQLASGTDCVVPPNLVILATMNPLDRGVDEVDAALERRFAKIAMEPDADLLADMLDEAGMNDALKENVLHFFRAVNGRARTNQHAQIGHTYFHRCKDVADLTRVWEHQLRFHFDKAYRLDADGLRRVHNDWNRALGVPESTTDDEGATELEE